MCGGEGDKVADTAPAVSLAIGGSNLNHVCVDLTSLLKFVCLVGKDNKTPEEVVACA